MKRRGFLKTAGVTPALLALPGAGRAHSAPHGLFAHGVASGDPLADRVMLWTHVSLPRGHGGVEVEWEVASDRGFRRLVARGATGAIPERDYCVKVDAEGLSPGRTWFYRFRALGETSMVGRTRTLPVGSVQSLALAVASCSNYPAGYFTAYADIARQDEVFAVVHLGDFIYEYGADGYASQRAPELGRVSVPAHELVTLDDYRLRHAQYKTDPDSIALHAAHPLIPVWDDHEVANDAWLRGAENHQPDSEGEWQARRAAAWRAYDEWMPTRSPDLSRTGQLYRSFEFGDLASLILLDTRYFGRDRQVEAVELAGDPAALQRARRDNSRELLGREQTEWLSNQLKLSADRQSWQIIGQQVLVSELLLPDLAPVLDIETARARLGDERVDAVLALGGKGLPMLWDTWDGYDAARTRFLSELDRNASSPVVLTGDIHTSIAGDLKMPGSNRTVGIELVTTSISSPGFDPYLPTGEAGQLAAAFGDANPWLKAFETTKRGWLRVDLHADRVVSCWRHVDRVDRRDAGVRDAIRLQSSHRGSGSMGLAR